MQYYSTNHRSPKVSLTDAIMHSAARDGGLYMPMAVPHLPQAVFNYISEMSPIEISYLVANSLFGNDISAVEIKKICEDALNYPIPLVEIEPNIYALELFHGPTMTSKDLGTRFLARLLASLHPDLSKPLNVMVATTGHSGSAVANGFHGVEGINVFVIYPKTTPKLQVAQVSSLGGNVHAIAINGTIDDCRSIVRQSLADKKLNEKICFTCANSVNIGRVLPQIISYFLAYAQLAALKPRLDDIYVSVPCGNCGTLFAGALAMIMGLPVTHLIGASNSNQPFGNYKSGRTDAMSTPSARTLAYGIDVRWPANAVRFAELKQNFKVDSLDHIIDASCTDEQISDTIRDVRRRTGYVLNPHSAVAYRCLKDKMPQGANGIIMATAHPGRSATALSAILDEKIEQPPQLKRFTKGSNYEVSLPPTFPAWRKYILNTLDIKL